MREWERHANAALRALGDAYQQGRIGRDTYRERRRRLMASFRDRSEVTARRALAAGDHEPVPPPTLARQRDMLPLMLGSRWVSAGRGSLLVALAIALAAVAVVLLAEGGAHG